MQGVRANYASRVRALAQLAGPRFHLLTARSWRSPHCTRLIVLDASFNPPTRAHVEMLQSAYREKARQVQQQPHQPQESVQCLLLLAVRNADKGAGEPAPFEDRLVMMEKMGQGMEGVPVHIGITTEPYFHDKLLTITASLEEQDTPPDVQVTFLAGFDTLIRIFNPKYYPGGIRAALDPFFEKAELRITLRPNGEWGTVEEQREWVDELRRGRIAELGGREEWLDRVEVVEGGEEGRGVSSSMVRRLISEGKDEWEDRVAGGVGGYVKEERLYGWQRKP